MGSPLGPTLANFFLGKNGEKDNERCLCEQIPGTMVPKPIHPLNNLTVSPQQFEYGLHLHPLQ